jgi:5,10-methylene-tetrahydrofolate dehydrogenase/methenyl tetrahydrofolate cyclohydrolase
MEMPAEFVPSSAVAMHPMAALLMNGIGPGGHHHGPQAQILHHQQIAQSSLPSTSASHQSILPSTPISSHHPSVTVVNGQPHIGNASNALLAQSNASMNPAAVAFLQHQHQQQQHEQVKIININR